MPENALSRRRFAWSLGAGFGAGVLGLGPATAAAPAAATPRPAPGGPVRLDSNENPYGPSPAALSAMQRSQSEAARYPDRSEDDVRAAIAKLHGVGPENVALGCGSGEILKMAGVAFVGPGKTVVAAEPTFEAVLVYAQVAHGGAVKVPLDAEHRHDLAKMAAACDARTGLVYVCNPNNPTGTIVGKQELRRFLSAVPPAATVLLDEAYHHFVEDPAYASGTEWLGEAPNLLVVRTFSKIYGMAGMRLGYAVGAPERIKALERQAISSNANIAVLEAALASLAEPAHAAQQRRLNNDTRDWLCGELQQDGRRFIPSHTNFLMLHVGGDVTPVIAAFRERGVRVGRKFPSLPDWLRVSIGTRAETGQFLDALRAIVPARAKAA